MAGSPSSPAPPEQPASENQVLQSNQLDPSLHPPLSSSSLSSSSPSSSSNVPENPNSNPSVLNPPPPLVQSFQPTSISAGAIPPSAPSFRPVTPIPMSIPQFSSIPNPNMQNPNFQNPNIQNPNVQPPGVNPVSIMLPGVASGAGAVTVSVSPLRPSGMYPGPPYPQMPNGYPTMPPPAPQGAIPPPGIPRYPTPYPSMVRPAFPPRPPGAIGVLPPLSRPPVPGIRGVPPIIQPVVRPLVPIVAPTEKPQTTVYVGKIASTVENDFMLSLLRLCGPVKSWKRAQDPSDGTPRGFGFCEFESAEGVLRALRLLSKFNVDGQELVLNVNQATREYLERYVEKKTEREKLKETETEGTEKEEESAPGVEKKEPSKPTLEDSKKDANGSVDTENQDTAQNFGIVTDEDREADRDALEKLTNMIEERLKSKPLPPPPAQTPADGSGKSTSEVPTKSRDVDSDVDIMKSDAAEDKNDDEMTSENKTTSEQDRAETSSPDKNRRYDRRSRDRDRERDLKREKERELERYERERERERVRRERERDMKIREAERLYKERVKEWESREREKEYQRQHEREREKERERERKREIMDQEDESDDDNSRKRRRRSSMLEEKRKKRQREKEDDMADRLREEEEIAEEKRTLIEEQLQYKNELKHVSDQVNGGSEVIMLEDNNVEVRDDAVEQSHESDSVIGNHTGDVVMRNGSGDESSMLSVAASDIRQNSSAPARKLGFGLVGSGKRTTVPSVFHEEDDDDANKDKKMRPLVPIDYSTEELQAVQPAASGATPSNLAAAAEFAKRISTVNPKEERSEVEKERNRRSGDRLSQRDRDRDRNDEESNHARDESREKIHDRDRDREHCLTKLKTPENKKLLDAKQLIDMIPKTKEELFSYDINWAVYDKHELHERMRPWISKKITEFLGEEEATLVDYIVSSTKEHVRASQMLELLQAILDDEAEMFVLKMWRMLIFEIKKVETGLSLKTKA
ncbi:RNA recognition motif domain [Macleaya cordata]|uniref:RNA recognition motif domain n=1 Tax=Macleaya cordata TaxID=56857 RepID=A0A200R742_MACCD|nr:RNA recognition motif domain [Macleaya cordata]